MGAKIKGEDPTPRQYVETLLPSHYEVKETRRGIITCKSRKGIDSDAAWDVFMSSLRSFFKESFSEVYHSTCTNHVNFTVYYKAGKFYPTEMLFGLNKNFKQPS